MENTFKIGDRVKALAFTDCFQKFIPERSGFVVTEIRHMPEQYGVHAYDRLHCVHEFSADVIEASERFFAKEAA